MAKIAKAFEDKMAERGYLTVAKTAAKAGISKAGLWNWIRAGRLKDKKGRATVAWMGVVWVRYALVEKLVTPPRGI